MSRSSVKVTEIHTALCMLVISMVKKLDNDAIAIFCYIVGQSMRINNNNNSDHKQ